MELLNECVDILELPQVSVLRRLVLEDGKLHEGLGNAVGNNTLWRGNGCQDNREQTVGQLVVDLKPIFQ